MVLASEPAEEELFLPNGASLDDGLAEDEAVLIALWNNPAFGEQLNELKIVRGDLVQAGLLPNPEVVYFFSAPEKPFKYLVDMPIEAFWLRPIRVAAAGLESARVRDQATQSALNLIRDVRLAYADVLLAKGRLQVAEDAVQIRGQIAKIAHARLQAGDISVQESATAKIDTLRADQDAVAVGYDVGIAEERLRFLMGIGTRRCPLLLDRDPPPNRTDFDVESLTAEALASRPDVLAASQSLAAATERLRLSRLSWFRFLGILDATSGRDTGHEFGPAARMTLPIFNWNQGNISRADAERQKAEWQWQAVSNQIILDVRVAHARYDQARAELAVLDKEVRPAVEAAIRRAELAYQEGNTSYVVVLETTRQLLESRLREAQLHAELRRAWAELERSVGRRLRGPATPEPNQEPIAEPNE